MKPNTFFSKYKGHLLMLFCAACLCLGQLLWKLMPEYDAGAGLFFIYFLGGFAIYFAGALSMIFAYRYGELSVLQPMNSLSYVFSTILGVFILKETKVFSEMPLVKIGGILLIIGGVIIIGRSRK